MNQLEKFLEKNNLNSVTFYENVYTSLLHSIFETIVTELDNDINLKVNVKKRILNSQNKMITISNIVKEYAHCELSEDEIEYMYTLIRAYFNKKTKRIAYGIAVRKEYLVKQNYKCAICNENINNESSELDHIIPWSFVGDELGDKNLQMLCIKCNRQKSANVIYNIKKFVIKNDKYYKE